MTILPPGTFRVSDYRKPIPERVKRAALMLTVALRRWDELTEVVDFAKALLGGRVQFDHRPALENRPYDTEAGDFIPPQHDPMKIDAVLAEQHKALTSGAPGHPYRGDVPMRARARSLANKTEDERARAAAKAGQPYERRTDIPTPTKRSQKPKPKIRSRSNWPKGRKIAKRAKPWGRK